MGLKIAFIGEVFYPHIGGAENRLYEVAKRLVDIGYDVHVYTIKFDDYPKEEEIDGINVHRVSQLVEKKYFQRERRFSGIIKFALSIRKRLKKDDGFSIYHFDEFPLLHTFLSQKIVKEKGGRCISTWHEVLRDYYKQVGIRASFAPYIEKQVAKRSDWNITVSEAARDKLMKFYGIDNISVIPNGVNYKELTVTDIKKKDWGRILYVGRLVRHKRVNILINIAKSLPDITIRIVGDGPEKKNLLKLSKGVPNVTLLGKIDKEALVEEYKKAWLFILPSEREGFSISSLEAMASSCPVIGIKTKFNLAIGDVILDDYNGLVFENDKIDNIANVIKDLLKGNEKWQKLSRNANSFAKNYDWSMIAEKHDALYKDLINRNLHK